MSLFEDAEAEPVELLRGGSSARIFRRALSARRADGCFTHLVDSVPWEQRTIRSYGKTNLQPRLVAWYGDEGCGYGYSGIVHEPLPWTDQIGELRTVCEGLAGRPFNSVLLNLYRDGNDSVAWHSDDEPELGTRPVIASLSLGAERRFDLRHKGTGETVRVPLASGSVVVMSGTCQEEWMHQIPKTTKVRSPRINLTFRLIKR